MAASTSLDVLNVVSEEDDPPHAAIEIVDISRARKRFMFRPYPTNEHAREVVWRVPQEDFFRIGGLCKATTYC